MILFVITASTVFTSVNSSYQTSAPPENVVRVRAELVFNTELIDQSRTNLITGKQRCWSLSLLVNGPYRDLPLVTSLRAPHLLIILTNNVRSVEKYCMFPLDWLTRVMRECKWFALIWDFYPHLPPKHFSPANLWMVPIFKSVSQISHGLPLSLPLDRAGKLLKMTLLHLPLPPSSSSGSWRSIRSQLLRIEI